MSEEKMLTIGEACTFLHVCKNTLNRWEADGLIVPIRTPGGHRRYCLSDLELLVGHSRRKKPKRRTIGYCRVSSAGQKDDLERQIAVVSRYCEAHGYAYKIVTDVGSGLNYGKQGIQKVVREICDGSVDRVVVNYKDRLMRFGYEMLEQVCESNGTEIEIINATDDVSAEDELVQDVLSIITVFSARLYGKRSHKNKRIVEENKKMFAEEAEEDAEEKGLE